MILFGTYPKPSDVDLYFWLYRNFKSLAKYAWEGATS